jgi:hypothetical protein
MDAAKESQGAEWWSWVNYGYAWSEDYASFDHSSMARHHELHEEAGSYDN